MQERGRDRRRARPALPPPGALRATRLEPPCEELVLLSWPLRHDVVPPGPLTPAEVAVAELALSGFANGEIARARGRSPRTVANQLASVYRKLCVASRSELAARLAGATLRSPPVGTRPPHPRARRQVQFEPLRVVEAAYRWHQSADAWLDGIARAMAPLDARLLVLGNDSGRGCVRVSPSPPGAARLHPRTLRGLRHLAAHLESAVKLRHAFPPAADPVGPPPRESCEQVIGERDAGARARLVSLAGQGDARDARRAWRGLLDGRHTLVDHWDGGGRRFLLVRRSARASGDPKALTRAEGAIVAYLAAGHSEKHAAFVFGIARGTVAAQFASARRKLGIRSRQDLVALFWHPKRSQTASTALTTPRTGSSPAGPSPSPARTRRPSRTP